MGGRTMPRPTLDREGLSVRRKEGSCLVGPGSWHLYLHAALGALEHGGEARLLRVGEHAGDACIVELRLSELGLPGGVVAGNSDEAVVGHGRDESVPDSYSSSHSEASASGSGVSPEAVRLRATYLPMRSNSRFTAAPSVQASDTFVSS